MAEFLGRRVQQQVAELRVAPRPHSLEKVLHGNADLALDAADRLLQGAREQRVGGLDAHGELQLVVGVEHGGRSFWDEATATASVWCWFRRNAPVSEKVIDIAVRGAGCRY